MNRCRLSIEEKSFSPSLTEISERLDIERLLQRAAQGIVDLTTLKVEGNYDGTFDDVVASDPSVTDKVFGCSFEDARDEFDRRRANVRKNPPNDPKEEPPTPPVEEH